MRTFKKWIGCPLLYNLFTTLWNGTQKMWRHYTTSLTTSPTFAGLTSALKQRDFLSKTIFVNCDVCVWLNKSYCFHTGRWTLSSRRSHCDSGLDIFEEKIFPHFFCPEGQLVQLCTCQVKGRRLWGRIWKLGEIPKLATDRGYNQAEMEKYDKLNRKNTQRKNTTCNWKIFLKKTKETEKKMKKEKKHSLVGIKGTLWVFLNVSLRALGVQLGLTDLLWSKKRHQCGPQLTY